ncbi:helix-turn-helix transcriptional regulator [Microlunatus elymi]|uniref:helix-turn-helix transcriptional regulator n=1 Tax=Microlunatus elymi TaxID=2596828 RepID=UPI001AEF3792
MDYPVESLTGRAGGYRLVAGVNLPPLVLDDDEAVAVAMSLIAIGGQLPSLAEAAGRVRVKLDQLLPAALRSRVGALGGTVVASPGSSGGGRIDPELLIMIGECCRDHRVLSFDYADRSGRTSRRRTEPQQLIMVPVHGYWYLIAHDQDRQDWRTFRVDRIRLARPAHDHFRPRDLDAATFLADRCAEAVYAHTAILRVGLSAERLRQRIWGPIPGAVVDLDDRQCEVRLTADSVDLVVQYAAAVLSLDVEMTLIIADPPVADRPRSLINPARQAALQSPNGGGADDAVSSTR